MSKEPKRNIYVGHRYVPKIMGEWDQEETYEGLSIVTHEGTSYTSKKRVPVGIDIQNDEYWVVTGNYNAQVETYRQELRNMEHRVNNELDNVKNDINKTQKDLNERGLNLKTHFDAKGDGVSNDSDKFLNALQEVKNNGSGTIEIPDGVYKLEDPVIVSGVSNLTLVGGSNTVIDGTSLSQGSRGIHIYGDINYVSTVSMDIKKGSDTITLTNVEGLEKGDMIKITTDEVFNSQRPNQYFKSEFCVINKINGNVIELETPTYDSYSIENNLYIEKMIPVENITIKNIKIKMKGKPYQQDGLYINVFNNVTIENVTVHDSEKNGVYLKNGLNAIVDGLKVSGSNHDILGYGVIYEAVQDGFINNVFGNGNRHSVEIGGNVSRNIIIDNINIKGDTSYGIATHGSTENIQIGKVNISNSHGGVTVRGRYNTFGNVVIQDCVTGVRVGEADNGSDRRGEAGKKLIINSLMIKNTKSIGFQIPVMLKNSIFNNVILINCGYGGNHSFNFSGSSIDNLKINNMNVIGSNSNNNGVNFNITPKAIGNGIKNLSIKGLTTIDNNGDGLSINGYKIVNLNIQSLISDNNGGNGLKLVTSENEESKDVSIYQSLINNNKLRGVDLENLYSSKISFYNNDFTGNINDNFYYDVDNFKYDNIYYENNIGRIINPNNHYITNENGEVSYFFNDRVTKPVINVSVEGEYLAFINSVKKRSDNNKYYSAVISVKDLEGNSAPEGVNVHITYKNISQDDN